MVGIKFLILLLTFLAGCSNYQKIIYDAPLAQTGSAYSLTAKQFNDDGLPALQCTNDSECPNNYSCRSLAGGGAKCRLKPLSIESVESSSKQDDSQPSLESIKPSNDDSETILDSGSPDDVTCQRFGFLQNSDQYLACRRRLDLVYKQYLIQQQKQLKQKNLSNEADLVEHNYYTNSIGNRVHAPAHSMSGFIPQGATARCRDGSYSFSQNRRGTCSHHAGVMQWLY
jgi:hypothetical protein